MILCLLLSAILFAVGAARADEERYLPGHSHQGEVFNRGPRQHAYLMGGTGKVHFPVSSKNPLVQKYIDQGVGQLHGFWFVEAERSFREAARLDPNCGIAYWGMSLANEELNPPRARQFAAEAKKHKPGLTEREQMYIDAIGKEKGYLAIVSKYPYDVEAKAFEVWRVWNKYERGKAMQPEMDAALRFAKQILQADPNHPIHHAIIHTADAGEHYESALDSAAQCGPSAPSIGHMWHMPTHIYYELKRYPEAAWQLEASMRTEHARMMHDRVIPDQVHLYAHNNEWLARTLLYLGRVHDARRAAMQSIDLPRHPLLNMLEPPEQGQPPSEDPDKEKPREVHGTSAYYGRQRLIQVLRDYEYWDDLIDLCNSGYIEMTRLPSEQGTVHQALGVAYYCRGDIAAGDKELAEVRQLLEEQRGYLRTALSQIKPHSPKQRTAMVRSVEKRFAPLIAWLSRQGKSLELYRRILTSTYISRTTLIECLLALAAAEILGFWFLRRRLRLALLTLPLVIAAGFWVFRFHWALANLPYEAIGVDYAYVTRRQADVGDYEDAAWAARQYVEERPNQVRPLANLVEMLYRAGQKDKAREEFQTLRELAGTADLDSPPLARLAPIARKLGYPTDWRLPAKIEAALAGRPPLESLGPFLWRPWRAPNWTLKDANGKVRSLAEFRGKPVVLIFFLGGGCIHCQQQLQAFAKRASDFADAGFTVIAVSTDTESGVKKFLKPGSFPFLMVADPDLEAFRSYRAYDDFEQIALHGTFVIDREGFARWQDVSFEPFMDVNFVLGESKRLLSRPVAPLDPGARIIAEQP